MKLFKYLIVGIAFGIILTKAEVVSWFRIYEMFTFESFHMYGVIGTAVVTGAVFVQLMKKFGVHSLEGNPLELTNKTKSVTRYLVGGALFGLGWAMTGACPGPMFILVGHGYATMLVAIGSAVFGTFVYGLVRHRLPH